MKRTRISIIVLALGVAGLTLAKPVTYTLPAEASSLKQASTDAFQKTQNLCGVCHSRDYITTQPPGKGKDFWTAEVTKMVNVYGAPIIEADRAVIAEYLAATY